MLVFIYCKVIFESQNLLESSAASTDVFFFNLYSCIFISKYRFLYIALIIKRKNKQFCCFRHPSVLLSHMLVFLSECQAQYSLTDCNLLISPGREGDIVDRRTAI